MAHRTRTARWLGLGVAAAAAGAGLAGAPATESGIASDLPASVHDRATSHNWMKSKWGNDTTREGIIASADGVWRADKDHGSLNWIEHHYGVDDAWGKSDAQRRKLTGQGVTVAVIDTGVAPVSGLDAPGKVVNGPDLSFESQSDATRYLDGYGHGTHMAAIIAARDAGVPIDKYKDPRNVSGIAPDSQILNVKVGTSDGAADVSQVIAAVDWVVEHRRDNGMNVRVINLSYGTHSQQPYTVDPLAKAVENAWAAGIVVVAAAGNDGDGSGLTMPAADPYVIAVGAVDNRGSDDTKDDVVAPFSSSGTAARRPDLLAPGKSVVSLRVPGSEADVDHPEGLVPGDAQDRLFRGSGTSQAAAIVSGIAALVLQARPAMTPDQVKAMLTATADRLEVGASPAMGAGVVDPKAAVERTLQQTPTTLAANPAAQTWPTSTGLGTLQASRGDAIVADPGNGEELSGEVDAMGSPWNPSQWAQASTSGTAWDGGEWNGRVWTGTGFTARSWSGESWEARSWSGRSWSGVDWSARSWSDSTWSARSWSGAGWVARSWSDAGWGNPSVW
jgi:serine protease AprX